MTDNQIVFTGCLIAVILIAVMYCKMVLIWRDVELKRWKRIKEEYKKLNEIEIRIKKKYDENNT